MEKWKSRRLEAEGDQAYFLDRFFEREIEMRQRGIVGKIFEVGQDYLIIETLLFSPHLFNFNQETKNCLGACFSSKNNTRECFDECVK